MPDVCFKKKRKKESFPAVKNYYILETGPLIDSCLLYSVADFTEYPPPTPPLGGDTASLISLWSGIST